MAKTKTIQDKNTIRYQTHLHDLMQKVNPKMPLDEIEKAKQQLLEKRKEKSF